MDNKALRRWLADNGYVLTVMGNNHMKVTDRDGTFRGVIGGTPNGGNRSMQNDVAALRRRGVPVPR